MAVLVFGTWSEAVVVVRSHQRGLAQLYDTSTANHLSLWEENELCVRGHIWACMYMNNQVYRTLLRKNEKGKKEKERKLQQPQRLRKM